jgi:hypothetical protein
MLHKESFFQKRIKMKRSILSLAIVTLLLISCENNDNSENWDDNEITNSSTRNEDTTLLNNLYEEILNLSNQYDCVDSSQWKFTAIGSKACGGPTGFIAYSSMIDENLFLEKVEHNTEQQEIYNKKWKVFSDCSVPPQPKGLECIDGKPQFYY